MTAPKTVAPITVAVVDDDLIVRTLVSDLLSQHSDLAIVGVHADGRDAWEALQRRPADVVVADISMPNLDGAQLTALLREHQPTTRVLAFTSLADEQSVSSMLRAGASGVVYKAAPVSSLADAIRATHAGLSVLSPRFSNRLVRPEAPALSETEQAVLALVSQGLTNDQIARRVHLTADGVKYHIAGLSRRLNVTNRTMLAVVAVEMGITASGRRQP
ncbi:response regulator [Micropruina sp.]|uniref:response regulator transcription factor n=1 Tax=Micropruina sp. TaxID=2737536 RepID=UPI0039E705DD